MSIATEITRISGNISDSLTAVANKGVTVPAGSTSDDLAGLIAQIQTGGGGGGTTTWQTMYDASTWISSANPNYFIISNYTTSIQAGETYRVTWGTGGTQYTCETIADQSGTAYDGYFFGNRGLIGGTDTGEPFLLYRDNATRMLGVTNATGGQNIWITIELQTTSGGGGADIPIFTIDSSTDAITCNKTYAECVALVYNGISRAEIIMPSGNICGASMTVNDDVFVTVHDDTGFPMGVIQYTITSIELTEDLPSWMITATITENGTYDAYSNGRALSKVIVNVPTGGGKNTQHAPGFGRTNSTAYAAVSGQSITVAKTGTYDVYWCGWRTSTGGTHGSCLYIDDSAHSSGVKTTFDGTATNAQAIHISNVSLTKDQVVTVRARSRGTGYYMYIFGLTIVEA